MQESHSICSISEEMLGIGKVGGMEGLESRLLDVDLRMSYVTYLVGIKSRPSMKGLLVVSVFLKTP